VSVWAVRRDLAFLLAVIDAIVATVRRSLRRE
jgi:hypothetical protein